MRRAVVVLMALVLAPIVRAGSGDDLAEAPGRELAARHCGACHSYRLVTAQRGDARFWTDVIRWMQATQGLWDLPEGEEEMLVAYLAGNYGEEAWGRRPLLSPSLLPEARD
jgi:mono/diheme cytochrome c family protein